MRQSFSLETVVVVLHFLAVSCCCCCCHCCVGLLVSDCCGCCWLYRQSLIWCPKRRQPLHWVLVFQLFCGYCWGCCCCCCCTFLQFRIKWLGFPHPWQNLTELFCLPC